MLRAITPAHAPYLTGTLKPKAAWLTNYHSFGKSSSLGQYIAEGDLVRQRANHPAIFPFEKPPHRSRKDQEPRAGVTEDEQLHVAAKRRAEPAAMFAKQKGKG